MFRSRTRLLSALVTCGGFGCALLPQTLLAWGYTGHRVVGRIAERNLSPKALAAVHELLGPDSLAETATWADEERPDPAMQKFETWHYMNLEDGVALGEAPQNPAGDILRTLDASKAALCDAQRPIAERRERTALDRPPGRRPASALHVGKGSDRGGNEHRRPLVRRTLEPARGVGQPHDRTDQALVQRVRRVPGPAEPRRPRRWRGGTFRDWAQESLDARASAYLIGDGRLGSKYQWTNMPLVEKRLYQAGVRLAATIEACLGK